MYLHLQFIFYLLKHFYLWKSEEIVENKGMVFKIIWDLWTTTLNTFKFYDWNMFTLLYLYNHFGVQQIIS